MVTFVSCIAMRAVEPGEITRINVELRAQLPNSGEIPASVEIRQREDWPYRSRGEREQRLVHHLAYRLELFISSDCGARFLVVHTPSERCQALAGHACHRIAIVAGTHACEFLIEPPKIAADEQ